MLQETFSVLVHPHYHTGILITAVPKQCSSILFILPGGPGNPWRPGAPGKPGNPGDPGLPGAVSDTPGRPGSP